MYVVVVGMGEVGRHVLAELEREGHDVVAVDSDPKHLEEVEEGHDVGTLVGYGASMSILRQAGCDKADLIVAVTDRDEVNLVAALTGRQLGARQTIARVQSPEFSESDEGVRYGFLGIDAVVNPRILVAQEIAKIARSHGALEVLGLAGNRVEMVQLELPASSKMIHKPLADLVNLPRSVLVAAVVTEGELRVPGGADVLLPEDRVYLIGPSGQMEAAEELFTGGREARRVCIVGGGVVGTSLARGLSEADVEIMLIERDAARAYELAVEQHRVKVIQGDGTDLGLLEEEQAGSYDLFAAVTDDDEVNLMAGLLAKRLGVQRVISLVHRPDYMEIYRELGIDVVLSPRITASEQILRFVRQVALKSLYLLEKGQAEVLELVAVAGSRIIDTPISRLNLPRGAIIATIVHKGEVTIPRGADRITPGDTVVVLTTVATRPAIERLFRTRAL